MPGNLLGPYYIPVASIYCTVLITHPLLSPTQSQGRFLRVTHQGRLEPHTLHGTHGERKRMREREEMMGIGSGGAGRWG